MRSASCVPLAALNAGKGGDLLHLGKPSDCSTGMSSLVPQTTRLGREAKEEAERSGTRAVRVVSMVPDPCWSGMASGLMSWTPVADTHDLAK